MVRGARMSKVKRSKRSTPTKGSKRTIKPTSHTNLFRGLLDGIRLVVDLARLATSISESC